jgi:hypothetical protein
MIQMFEKAGTPEGVDEIDGTVVICVVGVVSGEAVRGAGGDPVDRDGVPTGSQPAASSSATTIVDANRTEPRDSPI